MFIKDEEIDKNEVTKKIYENFNNLPQTNIIVCTHNMSDGIGDFIHALHAFNDIKRIGSKHKIKLIVNTHLSRLGMIIKVLTLNFPEETQGTRWIAVSLDDQIPELIEKNIKNIIDVDIDLIDIVLACNSQINSPIKLESNLSIKNFLQNTYFILNVSTRFNESIIYHSLDLVPKNCQIHSFLEYYQFRLSNVSCGIHEKSMGIQENEIGLKLRSSLFNRAKGYGETNKTLVLRELSPTILAKIMGVEPNEFITITDEQVKRHFSNKLLAIGYLNNTSKHAPSYFFHVLLGFAQCKNIHHIDVILPNGKPEPYENINDLSDFTIKVSDKQYGQGPITLNIITLDMISFRDMDILVSASDCVAGSGDNSFSDAFACKQIPFFSLAIYKMTAMEYLIDYIDNLSEDKKNSFRLLKNYFELLNKSIHPRFEYEIDKTKVALTEFMKKNAEQLGYEAKKFGEHLYQYKHVENYFSAMIKDVTQKLAPIQASSALGQFGLLPKPPETRHFAPEDLNMQINVMVEAIDKSHSLKTLKLAYGEMVIIFNSSSAARAFYDTYCSDFSKNILKENLLILNNREQITFLISKKCNLDADKVYEAFPEFNLERPGDKCTIS